MSLLDNDGSNHELLPMINSDAVDAVRHDPQLVGSLVRYSLDAASSGKIGNLIGGVVDALGVHSSMTSQQDFTTQEGKLLAALASAYAPNAFNAVLDKYNWVVASGLMSDREISAMAENPSQILELLSAVDKVLGKKQ